MNVTQSKSDLKDRATRLLAKVRHRQLVYAIAGRLRDSANYARMAMRVRREQQS